MFGFLKKKLQEAVAKFTTGAKEAVIEEKVEDEHLLQQAKADEERLLKTTEEPVEEIPETPRERAVHKPVAPERTPSAPPSAQPRPAAKPEPTTTTTPKPAPSPKPLPSSQQPVLKKKEPLPPQRIEKTTEPKKLPRKSVKTTVVAITYFVHGTTTDNENHRSSGQNDVDLSTLGIQQSKALASQLTNDVDVIYTSDLTRATHSATLTWPGRNLIKDGRLREADYGLLSGHPERELETYAEKHDLLTEGYPDGETLKDVERRMRSFLNDLYKVHKGKHVAIVAHKAPQLALEVLLNHKTWEQAIAEDWRKRNAWRPGWDYTVTEVIPEPEELVAKPPREEKKGFLKAIFTKKPSEKPAPTREPPARIVTPEPGMTPIVEEKLPEQPASPKEAPHGLFTRLKETFTKKTLSEEKFEELFWDLEVTLLENNVALEVIEKLKDDLKRALTAGKISRLGVDDLVLLSLKESIEEVLAIPGFNLIKRIKESKKRPYIIAFIGVNGSGKTTTLAKVANRFQNEGLSVVMAASDTFRAAAIDQLKEHADKLGVKLISQGYGADPAAVAFDAVEHAKAKSVDVVMIDTAGRLHSNTNLMAELQKVVRVAKPDLKIFIGESITGNDCVEQAKEFDRLVGIDAIILSKADVDEKGGAALSVSYVTKKPILYLGVGQAYGDLKVFDKEEIIRGLGL